MDIRDVTRNCNFEQAAFLHTKNSLVIMRKTISDEEQGLYTIGTVANVL